MINRSVLVGRLTRDPDLRYTSNGTAVVTFTVAVNRQFTNANGERDADFINCVIWRKAAENFANFTHKGSLVGIDGRIQTRNYENQQGQRVYVTEVVVDNFSLLEPKSANNNQNRANSAPMPDPNDSYGSNDGNNNNNVSDDPFAANTQSIDISDDDLPF
ncbi:single-stranded DNA-binding protein [Bombilactobacillus thymidiniphilus]|uniref:Single-stranded DNA-binding protein n=1 Tax=Bombilactobacillus thymidiniphilus TaxID=2923363 RepID=A0ABY4PBP3_9LACO|nr:single-stranded DNA-binding protein [Bombilactobacillus thymidiniphilus]UQS82957.1 single-stranded DNA-binding protein [Bombilactobacillus thymidiniphilus]